MTKIYELKQQQQELLDALYWCEEGANEYDLIINKLDGIEGSVERKLSYLSDVLAEAIALSQISTERRKLAAERLERKEKQAQGAEQKLREFILSVMHDFDIKQVKGDLLNVSRYERDSLVVPSLFYWHQIPDNCKRERIELDKKAINDFLKSGGELEGFELVKKETLRVS